MYTELTSLIERMPGLEEQFGIKLDGLYATIDTEDFEGEYTVEVKGEIVAFGSKSPPTTFMIQFVCKNNKGQVVETDDFYVENFNGYKTFNTTILCKTVPTVIKAFPVEN